MNIIPISKLIISTNRQRKTFPGDALQELVDSILSKGLMHPPVVQNDGVTLVAGERRYRALQEIAKKKEVYKCNGQVIPDNHIPVTLLGDLTPFEIMEAELEENVCRLDLSWQEKSSATLALHELRVQQAAAKGEVHTPTDTHAEITGSRNGAGYLRDSLILAKNIHIPEVRAAKTQKEAVKVLRKIKETEHRADLAKKVDMKGIQHDIRLGSMYDFMPELPDKHFDLIITDPPYGVDADEFGDMASTGHNYKDSWELAREHYRTTAEEGYRVTKDEAHVYAFCAFERFKEVSDLFDLAGWFVWPRPIIWNKGNGMLPRPEHGPRYTYECILFAAKGDKRTLLVRSDVISMPGDAKLLHGAQKPVDLYVDLISRSCLPGSRILDPFGGSGPAISAAAQTRCTVTLFELDRDNYNICLGRLKENPLDQIELEV